MIIDGKKIAKEVTENIKNEIRTKGIHPGLAVLLIGDDKASETYVNRKQKQCQKVGIDFHLYKLPTNIDQKTVLETLEFLNKDESVDAILVQLPLPETLDTDKVIQAISPKKDVDGFTLENIDKFLNDDVYITPGLAKGIYKLIEKTEEDINGKKALIISNHSIFSKPIIKILENNGCKANWCDSQDKNKNTLAKEADILIVASGNPNTITENSVKKDAIVIDVGINRMPDGQLLGDVDFDTVKEKAAHITPVPGGVGPVTIAMLLENTLELFYKHNQK